MESIPIFICDMEKRLVIFDLDGTLLDTIADLATATNFALRAYGHPEHDIEKYRYFVGNGIRKLVERALPEEARSASHVDDVLGYFRQYYMRHCEDLTAPYKGIVELLQKLQEMGVMCAVASNKFQVGTESLVKRFFSNINFVAVFGQREGVPVKPDPQIVFDIMHIAGVAANDVLYVGDSGVDMQTALSAGVTGIGVLWGFRTADELLQNGAKFLVSTPEEVLKILKEKQ